MRIAFTTKGNRWDSEMDPRFGRAAYLFVYDEDKDTTEVHDNSMQKGRQHGVGPGTAKILFDMKADVLVTGNGPGDNAARILEKGGIRIFTGAGQMQVEEAYKNYKENLLNRIS
jgi:predicted Fe-Mo cluster-binding NifX family protein